MLSTVLAIVLAGIILFLLYVALSLVLYWINEARDARGSADFRRRQEEAYEAENAAWLKAAGGSPWRAATMRNDARRKEEEARAAFYKNLNRPDTKAE